MPAEVRLRSISFAKVVEVPVHVASNQDIIDVLEMDQPATLTGRVAES